MADVSPEFWVNFLRWTIPLVTVLFYVLRGYGAIKNNPKYRYLSSMLLIYYTVVEASLLISETLSNYIPIYVNSANLTQLYIPTSVSLVLLGSIFQIAVALRIRYGYVPEKKENQIKKKKQNN